MNIKEVKSLVETLDKGGTTTPCLKSSVKHGLSAKHLHRFVKTVPENVLNNLHIKTKLLIQTEDEDQRIDLFFDIYEAIFSKLPVKTVTELLWFVQLISILALQNSRQPQPPLDLLRQLLYTIPNELRTQDLICQIAQKIYSTSSDIGDLTHMCIQCAHLGSDWNALTEILSWMTLTNLFKAENAFSPEPSIPELHKLIVTRGMPGTIRSLEMAIYLISLLINRLALKESGEDIVQSSNWLKRWLSELPTRFNSGLEEFQPAHLDLIKLQTLITNITTQWPEFISNSQ